VFIFGVPFCGFPLSAFDPPLVAWAGLPSWLIPVGANYAHLRVPGPCALATENRTSDCLIAFAAVLHSISRSANRLELKTENEERKPRTAQTENQQMKAKFRQLNTEN
jgi:hypothetical protein